MKAISKMSFFFCKPLETTTTARDVFNKVGSFLQNHDIPWEMFVVFAQTVLQKC